MEDKISSRAMERGKKQVEQAAVKTPPTLPWMRFPVEVDKYEDWPLDRVPLLDPRLQEALRKVGIDALFPVQVAVWFETIGPGGFERDLCICTPTGSGKTLAYALPLVQSLVGRVVRCLRALVVLPTRDLALQVKAVFDSIGPLVGLSIGLAVGQTSVADEADELVKFPKNLVSCLKPPGSVDFGAPESGVDVLVATPGRLMDHIKNTKGFTLENLLYLVVDETDRLLRESYQDWLPNVLNAIGTPYPFTSLSMKSSSNAIESLRIVRQSGLERGYKGCVFPRVMKMVLSATLTKDPVKISQLKLHHPLYISSSSKNHLYELPQCLKAFKLVCKADEKPLLLAALLQMLGKERTIIFTASVMATHRLYVFLKCFENLSCKVQEYSSLQHQIIRSKALEAFRGGNAHILVASDGMARGIDVEGVANIVNYDMPVYIKTYIHRVGRTARAGRTGCSFTFLRKEEVRHFKSLLRKAQNSSCKSYRIPSAIVDALQPDFISAFEKFKASIASETAVSTSNRI